MRLKLMMLLSAVALGVNAEPVSKFANAKNAGEYFEMQEADVLSSELIPVDQLKNYRLGGSFKNSLDVPVKLLLGVASFDANKKEINTRSVSAAKGTDTVLAEDCKSGDKTIRVKDASGWRKDYNSTVVFATDPELKDLPNYNYAAAYVETISKKGDIWEITMKDACGKDYPVGTAVRLHYDGNTFVYVVASDIAPKSEWTKLEGTIKQSPEKSTSPVNTEYFRCGTAFVKIFIMGTPSNKLLFKDIDFSPVP